MTRYCTGVMQVAGSDARVVVDRQEFMVIWCKFPIWPETSTPEQPATEWLDVHYPLWRDATAYWSNHNEQP